MKKYFSVPVLLTIFALIVSMLTPGWIVFSSKETQIKLWVNAFYSIVHANGSSKTVAVGSDITLQYLSDTSADPTYTSLVTMVALGHGLFTICVILGELWHGQVYTVNSWFTERRLLILLLFLSVMVLTLIALFGNAYRTLPHDVKMEAPGSLIVAAISVVFMFMESLVIFCAYSRQPYRQLTINSNEIEESQVM